MPTSTTLTEQLATLGVHLPAWPEEPEGGGATGDWIQRGQAYAEGVRLWRAQLRNAPDSKKLVVSFLLQGLCLDINTRGWDQIVCAACNPDVQKPEKNKHWQNQVKLIRKLDLTKAQLLGAISVFAEDQEPMPAIYGFMRLLGENPTISKSDCIKILSEIILHLDGGQLIANANQSFEGWARAVDVHERITAIANEFAAIPTPSNPLTDGDYGRMAQLNPALQVVANSLSKATQKLPTIERFCEARKMKKIKLHLGCGGDYWPGWINIDNHDYTPGDSSRSGSLYDIKMDIRKLEMRAGKADAIAIIHTFEHFYRWEAIDLLRQFYKKLKKGGYLHIEMPDLDQCIKWYMNGDKAPHIKTPLGRLNMGFTQFYGNQWDEIPFETHKYVWTKAEFENALQVAGFRVKEIHNDKAIHQKGRDMYVIAVKD